MDDHLSIPLLPLAPGSSTIQWYRDVAVWGAVGNLGMTTVGAVVLSLPAAVATIGWMLGLVLLVAFALMADASMVFLVRSGISVAADHPGREGMLDYEQVGRYLLGKWWALAIRATLLCLLVGAMASVNIIVVDMVQGNLQTFGISGTWYCSRWFISLVNIGVMWPFTLLEHLAQLSKVSLLAFASLAYVFVAVMWVCFTDPALAESVQQAQPVLLSPRGFLAVPVMALAYCAQFQVLPVYQSLPQHSRRHMETVIHVAIVALALPIYIGFGMLPYFDLGPDVNSDFLYISWPGNKLMTGARIFLSVMNMLKYPLVALPLRDILCDLIWSKRTTPMTIKGRFLVMTIINTSAWTITNYAAGLGWITDVTGAGSGMLISFVFPPMLYLAIKQTHEESPDVEDTVKAGCFGKHPLRILAVIMCVLGAGLGMTSLVLSLALPAL